MDIKNFCEKYSVDRLGTNSLKWDALDQRFGNKDLIAMWVADMEFKVPEAVTDALVKRIQHGVYGYSYVPDSYYEAFFNWQKKRHNINLKKEWIRFSTGVVTSLYWFVNAFTKPNDSILIITPVYYPFHNAVKDNNRNLVRSELVIKNDHYEIDFNDFEQKIIDNNVKLFIQCSPHNPAGRVWTESELDKLLSICQKHNVLVVSDEIHQDIIIGNKKFTSSLTINNGKYTDNLIVVTAPSKTFNLACLLNSHIIIPNEELRNHYDNYAKTINQTEVSILGQVAAEAAYRNGEEWLDSLLEVIKYNFNYLKENLNKKAPKIKVTELEGTYLTWLDLREYINPDDTRAFIQNKCGLAIDFGEWFSDKCKGFVRLNMATDPKYVEFAVENIIKNINTLEE